MKPMRRRAETQTKASSFLTDGATLAISVQELVGHLDFILEILPMERLILITRRGAPVAVLISIVEWERLVRGAQGAGNGLSTKR